MLEFGVDIKMSSYSVKPVLDSPSVFNIIEDQLSSVDVLGSNGQREVRIRFQKNVDNGEMYLHLIIEAHDLNEPNRIGILVPKDVFAEALLALYEQDDATRPKS
jgi:hypothetical protein